MKRTLRTAVIGLGWAGTVHARVLSRMEGIDLVAVADSDPEQLARYPSLHQATHMEQLLHLGLDYCVVATPTETHEEIGLMLAAAGINALIEKPLASNLAAAVRLADAFDHEGLMACVGHTERRNPAIRDLAGRLHAGDYGSIYAIATRRHSPFPDRIRDVGVVTDIGIHDVDLVTWLTGRRIRSVTAHIAHISGGPHEDFATATCVLDNGVLATLQLSRIAPFKERTITLFTSAGCVTVDAITRTVDHTTNAALGSDRGLRNGFPGMDAGSITRFQVSGLEPFHVQNLAFRDALLGLPAQLVTLREGVAAVAATEAILSSARTGTSATVSWPGRDHGLAAFLIAERTSS
ncbi:Gfo/Idh/MocA family oxidoreductase [Nonomuraea sp. NN258]|uniref:Gfo/Idh/MocA family protein n=1 Tax=Nonomuraea antri TaxID=2730852 RepID=UPI00156899D3|nr:Gfo/Idh/MocA family oxidoreductase [Nonomuraea antri]NRQ33942.1 Gfo/Idh/MocA family oxidoreductase [Nonomuraea antri]